MKLFHFEIMLLLKIFLILFPALGFSTQEKVVDCRGVIQVTPLEYNCRCFPLWECLCNPNYNRKLSNTTLVLSSNVTHYFHYSSSCIVINIENLTITSEVTRANQATIDCNNTKTNEGTKIGRVRNIIFNNVTQLTISNIDIINCGSEIPSKVLKSVNQSFFYIEQGQRAVVLITQSRHVTLLNINIQRYKGFAIFLVNVFKLINIVAIIGNTSCNGGEVNISCSFGAVVAYFHNPSSPFNESDNSYRTNVFLNGSSFSNNVNIYHPNDTCYTTDFHSAKKFPMITSAALTIIFCQSTFVINVNIENTKFEQNYGQVAAGILIVYRNSPSTAFVYLNNNYFCRNNFLDRRDPCVGTAIRAVFNQKLYKKYDHDVSSNVFFAEDTTITSHQNHSSVYISGLVTSNVDLQFYNFTCIDNVAVNNGICMMVEFLRCSEILPSSSSVKVHFTGVYASQNKYWYQRFHQPDLVSNGNKLVKNPSLLTFINIQLVVLDGISSFFENKIPVISAFNSDVKLKGEVRFENNEILLSKGILYLAILSQLIFSENVKVEFINNRMTFNDIALINAFSTTSSTLDTICAFQFEAIDNITDALNITFKNNSFPERNHKIIGELILVTPA